MATPKSLITEMTPEQKAQMRLWAERWIRIGLSTEPADWDRAERGILAHYRAAGLPHPRVIVRVSSPYVCVVAGSISAHVLEKIGKCGAVNGAVNDAVRGAVNGAVRGAVNDAVNDAVDGAVDRAVYGAMYGAVNRAVYDAVHGAVNDAVHGAVNGAVHRAVYDAVHRAVRGAVNDAVNGAVYDAVSGAVSGAVYGAVNDAVRGAVNGAVRGAVSGAVNGAVRDAVYDAVDGAVNGAVHRAVYDAVNGTVRGAVYGAVYDAVNDAVDGAVDYADLWHRYLGGAMWSSFSAYGTFMRDILGVDVPIGPREDTDSSCGWWWPHRLFCIVSDRPELLRRDDAGRLHSEVGPAVRWRDGWSLYMWHGVRVPAEWIEHRADINPALAFTWENIEQRRALAEIIGWPRVLKQLSTRVIDINQDPEIGTLLEADLPEWGLSRFLQVQCGTGRQFVLPVPPTVETAQAAQDWIWGLRPGEYAPEIRT